MCRRQHHPVISSQPIGSHPQQRAPLEVEGPLGISGCKLPNVLCVEATDIVDRALRGQAGMDVLLHLAGGLTKSCPQAFMAADHQLHGCLQGVDIES